MQLSDKPDAVPQTAASEVGSGDNEPSQCSAARGHHYGVFIIHLAVAFVVSSLNSYIEQETTSLPAALLGSSDIIESVFGKYKLFERQVTAQTYGPLDERCFGPPPYR